MGAGRSFQSGQGYLGLLFWKNAKKRKKKKSFCLLSTALTLGICALISLPTGVMNWGN
jgi:Tfp pilus assembly protein PilN